MAEWPNCRGVLDMQPGKDSANFERARNVHDLGVLGDPERWGGATDLLIVQPDHDQKLVYSQQVIRVQCADLVARSWDVLVHWEFTGLIAGTDVFQKLLMEISCGVGQAAAILNYDLTAAVGGIALFVGATNAVQPTSPWEFIPWSGGYSKATIQCPVSIPAAALSIRFAAQLQTYAGEHAKPYTIRGHFFAAVSPRSL
jgi:hypothetical protein